jgi:(1->4)-alpha-D-glucan 1-alpha-D-glucosylmutase
MNERHRQGGWPDRNAEYFFYQTLVGAWPLSLKRALAGMEKAAGEAKQHTSWTQRNEAYDTALRGFVTATLASMEFRKDLELFLSPLVEAGQVNSLAMTLLKLTAPGVPDIYQGSELWDHSLMDPDNRRPVDFTFRRCLLSDIQTLPLKNIWKYRHEGLPKLWLIQRVLALRARRPELFGGAGSYEPLTAQGAKAGHVIAFMRGGQAITIVPRLVLGLGNDWAGTTLELPPGKWRNVLADGDAAQGHAKLAVVLREFPVALLLREKNEE